MKYYYLFGLIVILFIPVNVFAAKTVTGVVPNPPPLFQTDPGVKPNLSGSIQNSGRAVLPGEEGSGVDPSAVGNPEDELGVVAVPKPVVANSRHVNGLWWLLVLVVIFGGYFGYRRWRK